MKKINLISKIIFIFQCLTALYLQLWLIPGKLKIDIMLYVMMYGIYGALPVAIVGVLCCLILMFKKKTKKDIIKNVIFILLHLLIGFWNYVIYNSLLHI